MRNEGQVKHLTGDTEEVIHTEILHLQVLLISSPEIILKQDFMLGALSLWMGWEEHGVCCAALDLASRKFYNLNTFSLTCWLSADS